ncbi:hypothetical protein [Synechococcus sp. BO 8801]|uniref:hypothetical protein n=1 Tax=Synechococcus sp. BO 8801 TaxID=169670 RepID=UPI000B987D30|nr:hypothetical protein [Synechococcus sp. BO 8801]
MAKRYSTLDRLRFTRTGLKARLNYLKSRYIFVHVPRCGGTYASTLIHGRPLGHLYADFIRRKLLGDGQYSARTSVAFVRCPVERLISAYCFSLRGGTDLVSQFPLHRPPRWALTDFRTFCQDWLFQQSLHRVDFIFRPQSWWLFDESGQLIVDEVNHLSRLDSWLQEKGFVTEASPVNVNASERGLADEARRALSPSLIASIRDLYAQDVALLSGHLSCTPAEPATVRGSGRQLSPVHR